ncbi:CHAT domain-containing protein [Boletus coccyginus]|nr:CHAT domain-containing protein [Boletus coccyginus]
MSSRLNIPGMQRRQSKSEVSGSPTDSVSDHYAGREQGNEESPGPGDKPQGVSSISCSATHADGIEEMVITSIQATDVALGLRRVPAGFYTIVRHSALEWRTENKRSSVSHDLVEWSGPIPIPSDLSATICFEVYASFEFQPMLGAGEQLRDLSINVEQLLNRSAKDVPFTLLPKDGDVASPCSSILVTINRQKCMRSNSSGSKVLGPHCTATESRGQLEDATNQGHSALSRYRKYGGKQDLERSIEQLDLALSICPLDDHCLAAAQSNLAMAKFIFCQVEDANTSLEVPLNLYRDALAARPVGHLDRPSTLVQLAMVHFARLEKQTDEVEKARAEALLHEATELSSTDSHENRTAALVLQLFARCRRGPVQADEQESTLGLTDEDPWISSAQLMHRFEEFGDFANLQQAITVLEELVRSTSVSDDRYSGLLGNLGAASWYRFDDLEELSDLEDAISRLRDAVDLTPHGHPHKPDLLSNLGSAFLARFEHLGELMDLEDAISRFRDAIDLTPHGHLQKPSLFNNLGSCLFTRFELFGELGDLGDAISTLRSAVDITPHGHPDKPSRLHNLGNSFLARFECLRELSDLEDAISSQRSAADLTPDARFKRLGDLSDLEDAISRQRDVVDLTPHGHPHKHSRLNNLGSSLFTRFERLGQPSDLEDAISTFKNAADLTPHDYPHWPAYLTNLGNPFVARFELLGELSDLEYAISTLRNAVDLTPHGNPDKPIRLNDLGNSFVTRFERLGELSDLEHAISTLRDAVDLIPHDHLDKPSCLNDLGNSFFTRFERLGELGDLEDAISMLRDAVDITPRGHPHKPRYCNNLGTSFFARFERFGDLGDLEDAISRQKDAVDLTHGNPHEPSFLNNLGNSFRARFERLGELGDLEDSISTLRNATDLIPHGHPDKPSCLNDLGNSLDGISRQRDAVDLTPDGHLHKASLVNNLGTSFCARFERLGRLSDLEDAISTLRDAVNLAPHDHPDKSNRLNNLGNAFLTRFERVGEMSDLEDSISTLRDADKLSPHGHPDKPTRLNNLGNSFLTRFERLGELSDLEDAISTLRDAVELTPPGHPHKPSFLNNLASSFRIRFERLGELMDLKDVISRLTDAVDLTPHGHPHKPSCLNSLANSFLTRFERLGELSVLENAISRYRDAVDLTPLEHPEKPRRLGNLGGSLFARFQRLGELSDLEDAISTLRDAADLTPHGHPHNPRLLNNLGNSFKARFERLGKLSDLEDAISRHRDAVDLTPHGHLEKIRYLNNLGNSLVTHFERLGELSDIEQAISSHSRAASAPIGPASLRFLASQNWISSARRIHHQSLLDAYSVAIALLPQLAWIGLSFNRRYSELMRGADVVREAAAAALDSEFRETVVEWLEQGRSIVWGELSQLRNTYDELSSAHPDHARRLQELSTALEDASAVRERSLSAFFELTQDAGHRATQSFLQETHRHRTLAIERDKLLHEIRGFPGFERFLLYKEFSRLRASAHSGPVVILNAAETRCDALIVLADVDRVIHVPLPNFTLKQSTGLQIMLERLLGHARGRATRGGISWEYLLSVLWNGVVKPVLDALAFTTSGDLSRIFWCPTGPFVFLPIHAAGSYDARHSQPGHTVSDFVVSSYAPTLSILALSPNFSTAPCGDLRLLTVRQPPSDGLFHLPGVATELEHIKSVIRNSPLARTTLLESSAGTVEEVFSLMKEADWVHFACHGIQDVTNPTHSGLCLADRRRLKLRDIIALARPRGGLAFLSACQTAMGDERLTDEAIHITAGMLFAGYGGVIGTMWSISDKLAPDVARDVYGQLFRSGTRPDYRDAAQALHDAIGRLRRSNASFVEWLPFIHVGL